MKYGCYTISHIMYLGKNLYICSIIILVSRIVIVQLNNKISSKRTSYDKAFSNSVSSEHNVDNNVDRL